MERLNYSNLLEAIVNGLIVSSSSENQKTIIDTPIPISKEQSNEKTIETENTIDSNEISTFDQNCTSKDVQDEVLLGNKSENREFGLVRDQRRIKTMIKELKVNILLWNLYRGEFQERSSILGKVSSFRE